MKECKRDMKKDDGKFDQKGCNIDEGGNYFLFKSNKKAGANWRTYQLTNSFKKHYN